MKNLAEYNKSELPAIEQLQELGWSYINGTKLSPETSKERNSLKDVVLEQRLKANIKKINPWISDENLHKVVNDLTHTNYSNLIEANQAIWTEINQCKSVKQDLGSGAKGQTVHIIDFENPDNNDFLCTNQFKVSGSQNIIPDIILFVNGLPLVVIECKSPFTTNPLEEGINQLRRYANLRGHAEEEGAQKLFYYNLMMVAMHSNKARVGTITSGLEHYLAWKDPYPLTVEKLGVEDEHQKVLIAGLFTKVNLLDILQNFTLFESVDGRLIKKIPRYHQFRAVHKTIERIKSGENQKKSGVIWHTQGSGKSLTMAFLSIKMRRDPVLSKYKLVFLTDRTQLDAQLSSTFTKVQGETIYRANSVNNLKVLLRKDSSDIITAMVQKFSTVDFPLLNASEKIIILADEAHRTQYGTFGLAINKALPNATRIAFTGTPLMKAQKTTNVFGSYIDKYTFEQAVKDEATVQILYEGRKPQLSLVAGSLDNLFERYFADRSEEDRVAIQKRYGTKQAIAEAPNRIREICHDIIQHYNEHIRPNNFKAMIVTSSRKAAITYKELLDEEHAPQSAVIISGDHNDGPQYAEHTKDVSHRTQIENFKKPLGVGAGESELSFLIVKDMLLTGFDAPVAQVMYIDRSLKEHTLLQAIARVNRTHKNKFRGYIVDYYGLSDDITEALDLFTSTEIQGALLDLKDEIPILKSTHTLVMKYFKGKDVQDIEVCNLLLKDESTRQAFQIAFRNFSKQMDIILPDEAALPFIKDLKWLGNIAAYARVFYSDEQLDISGVGEKVRNLINQHVFSPGMEQKISPMDLLQEDYKERLNQHKTAEARALRMQNDINDFINIHIDEDPAYYKTLSERLQALIQEHQNKWDEFANSLFALRTKIKNEYSKEAAELGLSTTEFAFYNALNVVWKQTNAMQDKLDPNIVQTAKDIVAEYDKVTHLVDFFLKSDEKRKVKKAIKGLLINIFPDTEIIRKLNVDFWALAENKFSGRQQENKK